MGFDSNLSKHTSYMFMVLIKKKSGDNIVQAYLSGILANKGGSIAQLSDNARV